MNASNMFLWHILSCETEAENPELQKKKKTKNNQRRISKHIEMKLKLRFECCN